MVGIGMSDVFLFHGIIQNDIISSFYSIQTESTGAVLLCDGLENCLLEEKNESLSTLCILT